MSEPRRSALARVQVVLEVETGSRGPDCTLGQATSQAKEEALDRVRRILRASVTADDALGFKRESLQGVRMTSIGRVEVYMREEPT